ncbi:MAG: hypothetical protein ACO2OX_02910 [Candidatus Nanopusillus sp.]
MFSSLTSSSNNLVNQQSQMVSFTISDVYCSNNTLYFIIYNSGNIPININNSVIIFTDNNGNIISINGSNIVCNNGNIIPSKRDSLCQIINNLCYYDYIDYIKSADFVYRGVSYNYDTPNSNRFNIIYEPNSSIYLTVRIYNTQSIPTPSPFQQQIAICNGTINIGPNFAYVNNVTLFNQIRPDGENVYFTANYGGTPNIYSWYLGQLVNGSTYCKIWWVNIPNGIPANSNIVIYMAIGNYHTNYYPLYYPYVGASPQVDPSRRYDNGKYVFIVYGYFDNTFDGWIGHIYKGAFSPTATPNGIRMTDNQFDSGTYILPPNNWNIPLIPLIVEEAWYHTYGGSANVITLFGNTSQQITAANIGNTAGGFTPAPNLSTFVQLQYAGIPPSGGAVMLKSAITYQYLNYTYFPLNEGTIYSYLIVNSTYAQAGYYYYSSNQVWVPLTFLNMYHLSYNPNYGNYTYANLDYNPFQYGTLQIGAGTGIVASYQYVQWVVARAYPPNGVMPSIYIN